MKHQFTIFVSTIASGLLLAAPAAAQTPDGQTPAEETVCSPLMADGIAKGLYGLCVAFCEAQDHADAGTPITEVELALLEVNVPSGRILANYNKKKQATDPAMPCIKVEEPCPCWSSDELNELNGVAPSGGLAETNCGQETDPISGVIDVRLAQEFSEGFIQAIVFDRHRSDSTTEVCVFDNTQVIPAIDRGVLITHPQATSCLEQLNTLCATLGF